MNDVSTFAFACSLVVFASSLQICAADEESGASRFPEIYLLNASVVREDLRLVDETKHQLDEIYREFSSSAQLKWNESTRGSDGGARKPDSKAFAHVLHELRIEYSAKTVAVLSESQRRRVKRIQWHLQSINRYRDTEFVESLELSGRQRGDISMIVESFRLRSAILLKHSAQRVLTREEVREGLDAAEQKAFEQIDEILTAEQRQRKSSLLKPQVNFGVADIPTSIMLQRAAVRK